MPPLDHYQKIIIETELWLNSGMDSDTRINLFSFVKCPYQVGGEVKKCRAGKDKDVIASCQKRLLTAVLTVHRDHPATISSLLGGISLNGSWRIFLEDAESTYVFARSLLLYLQSYGPAFPLDAYVAAGVCSILNEWLSPDPPWEVLPGTADLARHMVGDAWCSLVLPDELPRFFFGEVCAADLLAEGRPPFLPGLCPPQQQVHAEMLPESVEP